MKQMTCKQIGGPCDAVFKGETKADITKEATAHMTEEANHDAAHKKTFDEMSHMTEAEHNAWKKDFDEKWQMAEVV